MTSPADAMSIPQDPRSSFHGWIGVARTDVTPSEGIYARNWGASLHDTSEGVHRPLTATAISFQSGYGGSPAVLVSLDLGWWRSYKDELYVREYVLQKLKLDPARLMISLTHTHAGPVLCRDDRDKPGGELIAGYLESLRESIASLAEAAMDGARAGSLNWSYGTCSLACNRDLPDPAADRILCGYNPSLPADHTVLVGHYDTIGTRGVGTIVNYACHPTTLAWENRQISPDFVGAAREVVETHEGAPCLFLQGASGELAPRRQHTGSTDIADANGRMLGYAVLSTLEGMAPCGGRMKYSQAVESGAPLAVWSAEELKLKSDVHCYKLEVELPLQPMHSLTELDEQIAACTERVKLERLTRKRRIREAVGDGDTTKMPIWIWRLGDSFLVGHPNEAYSALQVELRKRFPDRAIAVMNVVNGHFGYLPPKVMYGRDMYPVWQTPFGPGSLETLIRVCGEFIARH